ncbi:hypothetical protein LX16_5297 [Stackebrandtia albiflava]|uniref:Uncharacterized protein n=1 Tax=Stackebrandtia albiflava TaxID=406432 RepID=A0A562UL39_9ACTN|nr:hypothetical protein [Stackebrandtia albiflava]TWJ06333.1 hypothetical protein LX16_5297 [Stackebrandtia albiflava]
MNDTDTGLDTVIPDTDLWAKFDEFKIAYVDALIEAEEVEDADEFYDGFYSNIWHQVHMNAQFILSGRPTYLDPVLTHLDAARRHLQTAEGDFGGLGGDLVAWSGEAATQFKTRYQDRFSPTNANQFVALAELTGFAAGYRQLMATALHDFDAVLDSAIAACRSYEKAGGGSSVWSTVFKVAGIGATVAGMVAAAMGTAGTSLGVGATIVGGFAGFGGMATESSGGEQSRAFAHPSEILSQLNHVSDALCEQMVAQADRLLGVLNEDLAEIGAGEALVIPRPDVGDLPADRYLDDFPYVGASNDMTVDLLALWMAGERRLPLVAVSYANAAIEVGRCDWRMSVGLGDAEFVGAGVAENLHYLVDVVHSRLGQMSDDLVQVGGAFKAIAEAYSVTDEGGAQALDALIAREREYGNLDDVPAGLPEVYAPDVDEAPAEEPGSAEAPGSYNPVMPSMPVDLSPMSPGGPYFTPEMPPADDPWYTSEEEYDPNGPHGGNRQPQP